MENNIGLEATEFINILKQYGIVDFVKYEELFTGISNINYKVYTKNCQKAYLLKVFQDKDIPALESQWEILNYLATQDYPYLVLPLKANNQKLYFQCNNKFGTLSEFIKATPPAESPESCFQIGQALAKLHKIKPKNNLRKYSEVGFPPQAVFDFVKKRSCPSDYIKTISLINNDSLQSFIHENFAEGIIHGDLYISNTLFAEKNLKAVIDFEQAGIDKYIYDIGISITGTCVIDNKVAPSLLTAFLKGYESIRKMPPLEKKYLNESILFGFLTMALWRIHKYKIKKLKPELINHYQQQLRRAEVFYESL